MVCSKWEETGLLYSSGELDELGTREYEAHLEMCKECHDEFHTYKNEKQSFFTLDVLGESPSDAVSSEILRVCRSAKKQYTSVSFFPSFAKKSAIPLLLLVIGFTTVSYIKFHSDQAQAIKSAQMTPAGQVESQPLQATQNPQIVASANDSALSDALDQDSNVNFSNKRGNLNMQGVVPVDLKD